MALSVRKFEHELPCPQPDNQINVLYHPSNPNEICDGNGIPSAVFSDVATSVSQLQGLASSEFTGSTADICDQGMDVVFLIDYTNSMGPAIDSVLTSAATIANSISTISNGNYRLGLVIYDGSGNSSPNYAGSGYYQALPAGQKISEPGVGGNGYHFFTCMEKLDQIGNLSSFESALDVLNSTNGPNGMQMGSGVEPGLKALQYIAEDGFGGFFRTGVQRLVVLVTDEQPANYFTALNTPGTYHTDELLPALEGTLIQTFINHQSTSDLAVDEYTWLANATVPQGQIFTGCDLNVPNGTWVNNMIQGIEDLCEETFIYNCEPAPAGWYADVDANWIQYYWSGTAWTNLNNCRYNVTINLLEGNNSTGIDITEIPSSHSNYVDSNTVMFGAQSYGDIVEFTWTISAENDYNSPNITGITYDIIFGNNQTPVTLFTDDGVGISDADGTLTAVQFTTKVVVQGDVNINVNIDGQAQRDEHSFLLEVQSTATSNNTPAGYLAFDAQTPAAGQWQSSSTIGFVNFSGYAGTSLPFNVHFIPTPSDYTANNVVATGTTESGLAINDSGDFTLIEVNESLYQLSGTLTMPTGGGHYKIVVDGDMIQPQYDFTINAAESIVGASIASGDTSQTVSGYTGEVINFSFTVTPDSDYENISINNSIYDPTYFSGIQYDYLPNGDVEVSGQVTMPSGGGSSTITVSGIAEAIVYEYTINIFTANWQQSGMYGQDQTISISGTAGTTIPTTAAYVGDAQYTHTITNVTTNDSDLTASAQNDLDLSISLVMPSGGGSGTITVFGTESLVEQTFTVNWSLFNEQGVTFTSTGTSSNLQQSYTAAAYEGPHTFEVEIETPIDWHFSGTPVISENSPNLINASSQIDSNNNYTITASITLFEMPEAGGSATVTINLSGIVEENLYSHNMVITDTGDNSGAIAVDEFLGAYNNSQYYNSFQVYPTVSLTNFHEMPAGATCTTGYRVTPNNETDYTVSINGFTEYALAANMLPQASQEVDDEFQVTFTMPSKDPRVSPQPGDAVLYVDCNLNAIEHTFTINFASNISNTTPENSQIVVTGVAGSQHSNTMTYESAAGYSHMIYNVAESGSNTGQIFSGVGPGNQGISWNISSMPSGGGSVTLTAQGTSQAITYTYTITWTSYGMQNVVWPNGSSNQYVTTHSIQAGQEIDIDAYLTPNSPYIFNQQVIIEVDDDTPYFINNEGVVESNTSVKASGTIKNPASNPSNRSITVTVDEDGGTLAYLPSRTIHISHDLVPGIPESNVSLDPPSKTITSQIGNTGSYLVYVYPDTGYHNPVIETLSISSDPNGCITSLQNGGTVPGSSNGAQYFQVYWSIPSSNSSAKVSVDIKNIQSDCINYPCGGNVSTNNPTSPGAYTGSITFTNVDCMAPITWQLGDNTNASPANPSPGTYVFSGLPAGTYTVNATGANGCSIGSQTVTLTDPPGSGGADSGTGSGEEGLEPADGPSPSPSPTPSPGGGYHVYTVECVSGLCNQGTGVTAQTAGSDLVPIGAYVTLNGIGGCWEVLSTSTSPEGMYTITGLCDAPTTTTSAPTTSTTTQSLRFE